MLEHLIDRLTREIELAEIFEVDMDGGSWGEQIGVLISFNEAKLIVGALKSYTQTNNSITTCPTCGSNKLYTSVTGEICCTRCILGKPN